MSNITVGSPYEDLKVVDVVSSCSVVSTCVIIDAVFEYCRVDE